MMSMTDVVAITVETPRMDSRCTLEKEFTKLIRMNPFMVSHLTVNPVDLCHDCVRDALTWETKDIFWMTMFDYDLWITSH